jgi:hypothetical protein
VAFAGRGAGVAAGPAEDAEDAEDADVADRAEGPEGVDGAEAAGVAAGSTSGPFWPQPASSAKPTTPAPANALATLAATWLHMQRIL